MAGQPHGFRGTCRFTGASPSGSLRPEREAALLLFPTRRPSSWLCAFLRPPRTCLAVWACTDTHVLPAPNIRRLSAEDGSGPTIFFGTDRRRSRHSARYACAAGDSQLPFSTAGSPSRSTRSMTTSMPAHLGPSAQASLDAREIRTGPRSLRAAGPPGGSSWRVDHIVEEDGPLAAHLNRVGAGQTSTPPCGRTFGITVSFCLTAAPRKCTKSGVARG